MVPWISDERLDEILSEPIEWIYVALRSGITGTYTELGSEQEEFLGKFTQMCNAPKVMAGFGIQDAAQVAAVVEMADAAIVGSALVKAIGEAWTEGGGDSAVIGDVVRVMVQKLQGTSFCR